MRNIQQQFYQMVALWQNEPTGIPTQRTRPELRNEANFRRARPADYC